MSYGIYVWTQRTVRNAKVGDKIYYLGFEWKVIDILPAGSRVIYRPWWKIRKTGVLIV